MGLGLCLGLGLCIGLGLGMGFGLGLYLGLGLGLHQKIVKNKCKGRWDLNGDYFRCNQCKSNKALKINNLGRG